MRQKTFITIDYNMGFTPKIGMEVLLVERQHITKGGSSWKIYADLPDGMPGNLDHTVKATHGWRGTTNDVATYAHGIRKITKVSPVTIDADSGYKITVGPDLYPDKE
jgi:hypothetical protein